MSNNIPDFPSTAAEDLGYRTIVVGLPGYQCGVNVPENVSYWQAFFTRP